MKNKLFAVCVLLAALLLTSCRVKYPVAQESGQEDIAYLLFVSHDQYDDETVHVKLDNTSFDANVIIERNAKRKGTAYSVAPGRRKITVTDRGGRVLYSKEIMLSTQETKQIMLP